MKMRTWMTGISAAVVMLGGGALSLLTLQTDSQQGLTTPSGRVVISQKLIRQTAQQKRHIAQLEQMSSQYNPVAARLHD